ncbi:DUF6431 domain-containing protein [Clostridium sp.]|uniref:DUF6431 domain-containing protein n=1 Tax=Clostridium sp. TaxID=1506 RepID=UPI00345BBD14
MIRSLVCPLYGAKHSISSFASYKRHLVTYDNNTVQDNVIVILRYMCSSCGHTPALLPSVIIPYSSFDELEDFMILATALIVSFLVCNHSQGSGTLQSLDAKQPT